MKRSLIALLCLHATAYAALPIFTPHHATHVITDSGLSNIHLRYRKASDIEHSLIRGEHAVLSDKTQLIVDDTSNQLWLHDTPDRVATIKELIRAMDTPSKQISIAVKMMAIDTNALESLGLRLNDRHGDKKDSDWSHALINAHGLSWWLNHLDAEITHGSGEMIASPTLLVANHKTASIESGQEVPYQERTHEGDTTTSFKNATLHLDVQPDLLPKQQVNLRIHLNQDKVSDLSVAGMPAIQTQKIDTTVRAGNHQTIILGGVYTHRLIRQHSGVPFLQHIPLLGHLFQHTYWLWQRQELMIFVTPSW